MKKRKFVGIRRLFFFKPASQLKEVIYSNTNNYALICLRGGILTKESIEAARKAIKRVIRKTCYLRIRVAAFLPVTQKPSEVRMGKGKGKIKGYISIIRSGQVLFEVIGLKKFEGFAKLGLLRASVKLPVPCKVICLRDR